MPDDARVREDRMVERVLWDRSGVRLRGARIERVEREDAARVIDGVRCVLRLLFLVI